MKQFSRYLLSVFYLTLMLFFTTSIKAQTDTEFWFAAPKVAEGSIYGATGFNKPIFLRMSTMSLPATVTITQPANPAFVPRVVNIPPNTASTVDLTSDIATIQNGPADVINNYGLRIVSTAPITAYYEVASLGCAGCNPEMFSLKGNNALGTAFFTPFQNVLNNGTEYTPTPFSSFDIVASEDNTSVTITPTKNIVGHAASIPFIIILNRGQTYSAQAVSQAAADHLGGSKVTSDKPIAITIKDDLARGGALYGGDCDDLIGDQLVPVNRFGYNYAVIKGYLNTIAPEKAFIVASEDNTTINVAGSNLAIINAGQTYVADITQPATYITSTKPTILLHMSGFACETAGAILPALDCNGAPSGSPQVAFVRSTNQPFFANILVRSTLINNFLYNGVAGVITASDFSIVPNTNGAYSFARISLTLAQLPEGASGLIDNTAGVFQLGIIHGDVATGVRYAYFSDFKNCIPVTATVTTTGIKCFGDNNGTATFTVSAGVLPYTLAVSGPTPSNQILTTNPQTITGLKPGSYTYIVTDGNGAATPISGFTIADVAVPLSGAVTEVNNINCVTGEKGSFKITPAGGTNPYVLTGTGIDAPGINITVSGYVVNNLTEGTYNYVITDKNGCTFNFTVTILNNCSPFTASVTTTGIKCFGDENGTATFTISGGVLPYTLAISGPTSSNQILTTNPQTITGLKPGGYTYVVTDGNGAVTPISGFNIATIGAVLSGSVTEVKNINCITGEKGSFKITPAGGTSPYVLTGTGIAAPGINITSAGYTVNNLSEGTYNYVITDKNDCKFNFTVSILRNCNEQCFENPTKPTVVNGKSIWSFDISGNVVIRTTLAKTFVDNTYGNQTIGWPSNNHTFNHLVTSDQLQLALYDAAGVRRLEFKMDYISKVGTAYKSLGVLGGDGAMIFGSSSNIVSVTTSLEKNLSLYPTMYLTNSPATDANYTPNPAAPNWIYDVWYEVTVSPTAFPGGFGYPRFTGVHASPSKTGNDSETVIPVECPGPLSLGNRIWVDTDDNGVLNGGETGLNGLTVKLYKDADGNQVPDGAAIASTLTGTGGTYLFNRLQAGRYIVGLTMPANYVPASNPVGVPDNDVDNDNNGINLVSGELRTNAITLIENMEPTTDGDGNNGNLTLDLGIKNSTTTTGPEGCSHGFYKINTNRWGGVYTPNMSFYSTFGIKNKRGLPANLTLLQSMELGTSGYVNVARQGTAALLNASHPDVDFPFTADQIIAVVKGMFEKGTATLNGVVYNNPDALGTKLDQLNNLGCPLSANNTTRVADPTMMETTVAIPVVVVVEPALPGEFTVTVMPNPTRSQFTMEIQSKDLSPVRMRLMDNSGRLIKTFSNLPANHTLRFGNELKKGAYFAEVIQGEQRKIIKLVKM